MFGREREVARLGSARRVVPLDPDRSLVRAAQADPSHFDALYRKYLAQVYSFAHHELGDHHEAEDVTERTFMLALGALPRFRDAAPDDAGPESSTFRVWLFRIARNVIANHRRAARRRPTAPLEAAAGVAAPEGVNPQLLDWGSFFVKNLLPVTIGNIVGGGVFVGMGYWGAYLRAPKQ